MLRGVNVLARAGRARSMRLTGRLSALALRAGKPRTATVLRLAAAARSSQSSSQSSQAALHTSAVVRAGGPAGPTPTTGVIPFVLADIGEGIAECEVMKWFVKDGDRIAQFDKVCLVQSDKATVEITSRYDGVVTKLHYKKGDMAKVGSPLIDIDLGGGSGASASAAAPAAAAAAAPMAAAASSSSAAAAAVAGGAADDFDGPGKPQASPAVRRIAKEHGVNLALVTPTGPKGRILKEDVQLFMTRGGAASASAGAVVPVAVAAAPAAVSPAAAPAAAAAKLAGPFPSGLPVAPAQDVTTAISGLARIMVQTMTASNAVPQFGYCDEIAMDALMALREQLKRSPPPSNAATHTSGNPKDTVRISYMPFMIKATSMALRAFPQLNAHVNPGCTELTVKASHNIGLAMDTPRGLLVPNIKNVQNLSVWGVAAELNRLQTLGKQGMIGRNDLQGATFTLSNIGTIGGTYAKPLVVVPEIVIGALGKIQTLPRYNASGAVVPANLMVVSWSADHRVVDGATMARFSNLWKYYIENPAAMLLDTK